MANNSGNERRKPTDNKVIRGLGERKEYKHHIIEPRDSKTWYCDGEKVGSLSNLSKRYAMNVETHDIGGDLEKMGYVFQKPFKRA